MMRRFLKLFRQSLDAMFGFGGIIQKLAEYVCIVLTVCKNKPDAGTCREDRQAHVLKIRTRRGLVRVTLCAAASRPKAGHAAYNSDLDTAGPDWKR
jgi:hypothetical protein